VGERPSDEEMADWLRGGSGARPNGGRPVDAADQGPVKIYTYDEMLALPEACFAVEGVIVYRIMNLAANSGSRSTSKRSKNTPGSFRLSQGSTEP
jgi:hypothetical protein